MFLLRDAIEIYNNGFNDSKQFVSQLILISLYMRDYLNYKPKQIRDEVYNHIYKYKPNFNRSVEYNGVNKALNAAKNKKLSLLSVDKIPIYKCEFNYIKSLDIQVELKQIMFTLLFEYKKSKVFCDNLGINKGTYKINTKGKLSSIKRSSCLPCSMQKFCNLIQKLCDLNLINNVRLVSIYCDFIQNIPYDKEDLLDNIDIECNTLGWGYLKYEGNLRSILCPVCHNFYFKPFNIKEDKTYRMKRKYCPKCAKIVAKQQMIQSKRRKLKTT